MRINREELLTALELLRPGLSLQETIEQSSCYVFRDGYAMTFNDEIACSMKTPLKIHGAVAAKPLTDLLAKLKEDEIEIAQGKRELTIKGKGRRAGVRMESEVTLPIETVDRPTKWRQLPSDFLDAIRIVAECAGNDESNFSLTCVHLHPKWVEACDNAQMTRFRTRTGLAEPALARRDSIRHIVLMGMTEFAESDGWLHFRNPAKLILSCRRWVEDYPNLKDFLQVTGSKATLPKGLSEAAERADVFSSENADNNQVSVTLEPGRVVIRGQGSLGWYRETRKIKYSGPAMTFAISPKLLGEIVTKHPECEITKRRLKVDGGKFTFVTCLSAPERATGGGKSNGNQGKK